MFTEAKFVFLLYGIFFFTFVNLENVYECATIGDEKFYDLKSVRMAALVFQTFAFLEC